MKENAKENELVKKLTNKHYTITTAESCTGGLLSATIINVSGASDVINCAYVTYANEAKENLVSVSHETLETKGAVSKETAAEMCVGCAKAAKADMGLSTTGIAGPGGGTKEKPVGLVYEGCAIMKENAKENELVKKLTNKHYTITTAESCTGGLLSATIINVSGASDVINCAYVTYANEAKENLVSVSHETLETKGAVSKETAAEMCVGCAKAAKADMGLSTTGIAGPGGGTKEKPVGLVYLGCSLHEQVTVERHVFSGDREQVRKQAVDAALDLAIRCLDKE